MVLGGLCEAVIALFIPPLAVFLRTGCSLDLCINILLCLFGWIPGIIHAELVILFVPGLREKHRLERERRRSRQVVEYYEDPPHHHHHSHHRSGSRELTYDRDDGYGPSRADYADRDYASRAGYAVSRMRDFPARRADPDYYPPPQSRSGY